MIDGVQHIPLKVVGDERGAIMHMLRVTDPHFLKFGEVYFSSINPGVAKAWQRHKLTTVNISIPVGKVRIVIFDDRENSQTKGVVEHYDLSPDHHALLSIPPGVWYGYFSLADKPSLIVNCATEPHQPDEQEKLSVINDIIPYSHS